jgi:hypothetical protein
VFVLPLWDACGDEYSHERKLCFEVKKRGEAVSKCVRIAKTQKNVLVPEMFPCYFDVEDAKKDSFQFALNTEGGCGHTSLIGHKSFARFYRK